MKLTEESYYDKVLGAWMGKCAGGILGAPVEGLKSFNKIKLTKKLFETNYPNDDLDLQVVWLDLVKKKGISVRENDLADHWIKHVGFPWNEYGIATRNMKMGLFPPDSGAHNNAYFGESMGCPIRSELWGLLNPGDPCRAAFYAGMDASVDHYGFSIDAEKFLSACTAVAFFESDPLKIFNEALKVVDKGCLMAELVRNVMHWHAVSGFIVAKGRIKSLYGDANFTSAPMNIGFTLLVILEKGTDFHCVVDALHMGHDSDCIAATAGAFAGLILGYKNIPRRWKALVGNELLISREITGINVPRTITELARQTCEAGIQFIRASKKVELPGGVTETTGVAAPYHIKTICDQKVLKVIFENLSSRPLQVRLLFRSDSLTFASRSAAFKVNANDSFELTNAILRTGTKGSPALFTIDVLLDSKKAGRIQRGTAYYGSWLLIGPFIEEDSDLADQYHPVYPEHGVSSLPSVQYMNHDKIDHEKKFLSYRELSAIAGSKNWDAFSFGIQRIFPESFCIRPGNYYYGRGERVIYLFSHIYLDEPGKLWVSIGCANPFILEINGRQVYRQDSMQRSWPGNSIVLHEFKKGKNGILLRLGLITGDCKIDIGFKEFTGRHPHQEQWSLTVPEI